MKNFLLYSLFLLWVPANAFAINFIDNPNFDIKLSPRHCDRNMASKKGWCGYGVKRGEYLEYEEQFNGDIIVDCCLSVGVYAGCGTFDQVGSTPNARCYLYEGVSIGDPLYFLVEVSYDEKFFSTDGKTGARLEKIKELNEQASSVAVAVEILENEEVLTRKKVIIKGSDRWHVIAANHEVYKRDKNSKLSLRITFSEGKRVKNYLINYAQVGTNPSTLGGRGSRDREG